MTYLLHPMFYYFEKYATMKNEMITPNVGGIT